MAKANDRILAITAAMPDGTGLSRFQKELPDRFFDVGIAEEHAVTFAAGLAVSGYKPVVSIYSSFYQRAYDQILHDVCIQKLPVTLILTGQVWLVVTAKPIRAFLICHFCQQCLI